MEFFECGHMRTTHLGSDAGGITRRALQPDANAGRCALILEQASGSPILADAQVQPAIVVVVSESRTALLPINPNAAFRRRNRVEPSFSVAPQP